MNWVARYTRLHSWVGDDDDNKNKKKKNNNNLAPQPLMKEPTMTGTSFISKTYEITPYINVHNSRITLYNNNNNKNNNNVPLSH